MFNVQMASEAKSRTLSREWVGDDLRVELMPFSFTTSDEKSLEVRLAPCAYIDNLVEKIFTHLENLERYKY